MKTFSDFTDDVNGIVIGDLLGTCWLTYEGRKQGSTFYPSNEAEAYSLLEKEKQRIMEDCGEAFKMIYPKAAWVFNFDGI